MVKLVNLVQSWTCRPLIRPIIHLRVMLEGSESPKSLHKLVLPENVSISAFYTIILGEIRIERGNKTGQFGQKQVYTSISAKCVNLKMGVVIFLKSTIAQSITNVSSTTNLQLQASLEYILMKNLMEIF